MDKKQKDNKLGKKEILFPNGNKAQMVAPPAGTSAASILKALGIKQPKALFMIFGGAAGLDKALKSDETLKSRLIPLFSRGIARTAAKEGALIMDGGTHAGVMALIGQAVADQGRKSILLGVSPAGKVTYPGGPAEGSIENGAPLDPNNSHFVLVESDEWGGETEMMFELAEALTYRVHSTGPAGDASAKKRKAESSPKRIPCVAILINGDSTSREEVLQSVRHGWPVIVIEGSGRLADKIARLSKERGKKRKRAPFIDDPIMAEIIAEGDIHLFPLKGSIDKLEQMILQHLKIDKNLTLELAWKRFAHYDVNAMRQQSSFDSLQLWILRLGVFVTFLVLYQKQFGKFIEFYSWQAWPLKHFIILLPITISVLVAAANRFKAGNKWVLLRAAAEAVKREIYRFRTQAEGYSEQQIQEMSPDAKLASELKSISSKLMQTEVNLSALRSYDGLIPPKMYGAAAGDDGFSLMTPERYISIRLGDQLNYYQLKTNKLERKLKRLQWFIYGFGGLGTFLAAVGLQLWIALTTAIVGAFTTYLEYRQEENSLMKYNQAATDLGNVQAWWTALSAREKENPNNLDVLVKHTEEILQSELRGWVQQMEDALAKLQAEQVREEYEQ